MRELGDGRVELHLRLSSLHEVHRWILKYGGDAVVTNPPQLEEMIIESGKKIAAEQEKHRALRTATATVYRTILASSWSELIRQSGSITQP